MGGCLHIVGLGPAGLDGMTLGDYKILQNSHKIFLRTFRHPAAQELLQQGLALESFDELYQKNESFETVYTEIVSYLERALQGEREVVYAVPGNPMVAEKTVLMLKKELSSSYRVIIHSGQSFLDQIFSVLGFDPIEGMTVRNYDALLEADLTGKDWLIVPQVYNRLIASDVKLDLMRYYPDDAEVYLVQGLGTENAQVDKLPLYELDHGEKDHLTTLVVPPQPLTASWSRLEDVIRTLRSPEGCPWDREQTHESLKPFLLEETYEVLEAIDQGDMYNLCEELGDLLLQVFLHAQIGSERNEFSILDVVRGITAKMIRRHPHVFGNLSLTNSVEVLQKWEEIKKAEKGEAGERLKRFKTTPGLPALMLAEDTQKKAAKVGFDWPELSGAMAKVNEELKELTDALEKGEGIKEELGDVLFSIVNISRFLKVDPEDALRQTIRKFQYRFEKMEDLAGKNGCILQDLKLDEMDLLWEEAKLLERQK